MAEFGHAKVEQSRIKNRNVPVAVTPEGFWCCPSPVGFQKTTLNKPRISSPPRPPPPPQKTTPVKKPAPSLSDEGKDDITEIPTVVTERVPRSKPEPLPKKVAVEFGESRTSDLTVILIGKHGFCVKLSVHKNILAGNSSFFVNKLSDLQQSGSSPCIEIEDCEDVEIYVETIGLMYSKDMKQRLIRQTVLRVLRIIKVSQLLGFNSCLQSCLEYLEVVPWVGEEEEEKVISSVLRLQIEGIMVNSILKRVSSSLSNPPKDTITQIIQLVLTSNDEKSRREMKSTILKLLKENNNNLLIASESIYSSIMICVNDLITLFKKSAETEAYGDKESTSKKIAIESGNLIWLLEILINIQIADEFALMWANQQELASLLHPTVPIVTRHHVSLITARLFVGIGRGEILPSKNTRKLLLETWLQPLINDFRWLNHGCRSFDRTVVEDGIGKTILTLPLEDQQSILLSWLGSYLKGGDNCPNLQKAFEVWWRRAFIRSR